MTDDLKLPPGREPLRSDWFVEQLGTSQQKVMSLTVQVRELKKRAKAAEEWVEILEELLMDVVADLYKVVSASKIDQRIGDVMKKLDEEQPDD
jgi:hypothetical protein